MEYYMIDLERTIQSGKLHYWKWDARGYTTSLLDAGMYSEEQSANFVNNDFDKRTVRVHESVVSKLIFS